MLGRLGKNVGFKCKKPGASVPSARKNVEVLTGNHKGRFVTLIEAKNQSRLLIGREVVVGKKKNGGWFEILAGEKLRLKSSAEAELVTVSSDEKSVVSDLVSSASNRSSAVSDDESCVCSGCKRRFDTARGGKVHEARFCKSKNSKSVTDSASEFVGLEKSLTCQKCTGNSRLWKVDEIRNHNTEAEKRLEEFAFSPAMSTIEMEWSSKM